MSLTDKQFKEPIVFNQASLPWRDRMYSNSNDVRETMATSGSAPTLCASIVYELKDSSVDPWVLAQLSMHWGCKRHLMGTNWEFFKKVAEHYKFQKFVESSRLASIQECLDTGGYVICSVGRGFWSDVGNYILLWKYDGEYIYAHGSQRHNGKQKVKDFMKELRMGFCFYPDEARR